MTADVAPAIRALTVPEVCAATTFCRSKVLRLIYAGELRAKKHGRRVVVLERDLVEFLDGLPPVAA